LESFQPEVPSEPVTVLVVDDCANIRMVLEEVLRSSELNIITAATANEALGILESERPDVIVSDIMMPETDGYTLQQRVREHPEWAQIPFIFLTALSDPTEIRVGKARGCDEYLTKPFDPEDLRAVVRGKALIAKERREKNKQQFEGYRKRVIHTLSHEFRTPLVAINTGAELLLDRSTAFEEQQFKQLLESIHRGGLRLQRLVEDFMSLQQIETGSAQKVAERLRQRIDLETLAKECIDYYLDLTQNPSLLIELRSDLGAGEEAFVEVYDAQIHNIISRLLSNAHKFGGSSFPALLMIRATMDTASLIVRDRGPGLPEMVVQNACELFSQINRDRLEQQGCGIGLTIASHYAKFNGGSLLFHSPFDGVGLAVELRLPRVG
jgi:signal transduction histidine kinase